MMLIALKGVREVSSRLEALPAALRASLARAIGQWGLALERAVRGEGPAREGVRIGRGAVRAQIALQLPAERAGIAAGLGNDGNFARFREFGAARMRMRPGRRARTPGFGRGREKLFERRLSRAARAAAPALGSFVGAIEPELRERVVEAVREGLKP